MYILSKTVQFQFVRCLPHYSCHSSHTLTHYTLTATGQLVHLSHSHGLLLVDPATNHTTTVITANTLVGSVSSIFLCISIQSNTIAGNQFDNSQHSIYICNTSIIKFPHWSKYFTRLVFTQSMFLTLIFCGQYFSKLTFQIILSLQCLLEIVLIYPFSSFSHFRATSPPPTGR